MPPVLGQGPLVSILRDEYGLNVTDLTFLPLGADVNTAVYRVAIKHGGHYLLKLRKGKFDETSVAVPKFLHDAGMLQVIAPLPTRSGQLWVGLPPFHLILWSFIEGRDASERKLTDAQWIEFGSALRQLHTAAVPADLARGMPREDFSPRWRHSVRSYLASFERMTFHEPLAVFLKSKSAEVLKMLERAEQLADVLKMQPLPSVLCHGDVHGWNLLVGDGGSLYLVDWDTLIFAPAERDLMFIGAGLDDTGRAPQEEEALFYRGYGPVDVNRPAIAYYRYERIIDDIAAYCDEVFALFSRGADHRQALENVMSNFRPGGTAERAKETDLMRKR